MAVRRARRWGNALGGWRKQRRNVKGQFASGTGGAKSKAKKATKATRTATSTKKTASKKKPQARKKKLTPAQRKARRNTRIITAGIVAAHALPIAAIAMDKRDGNKLRRDHLKMIGGRPGGRQMETIDNFLSERRANKNAVAWHEARQRASDRIVDVSSPRRQTVQQRAAASTGIMNPGSTPAVRKALRDRNNVWTL